MLSYHPHPMDPVRIDVPTPSRAYPVTIGDGALDRVGARCSTRSARRRGASSCRARSSGGCTARSSRARSAVAEPILVPDGERFKQLPTVSRIYDALVRANADRASTIITFGGGVIGDMAGFAAATYLRGIALVHVPTTLLAQVDSAIGGKVGVNHPLGKNLIGAFYQPHAVVVDPPVLGTLPRREFRAGLYEVIKYGMTSSRVALRSRRARAQGDLRARARRADCRSSPSRAGSRREVVSADEREAGPRRILNFGHTAGHALEAVTKYRRFRHGEAVGYGMLVAAELARARGALRGARPRRRWPTLIAQPRPAAADRRPLRRRRSSRRCSTTRRSSPARCTSSCRPRSARRRSWTM